MHQDLPYYAVIFTAHKSTISEEYRELSRMLNEAINDAPGYLGQEHQGDHTTITVSYWKDLESIQTWRQHAEHLVAQRKGKSQWYDWYNVRICKVERAYQFNRANAADSAMD